MDRYGAELDPGGHFLSRDHQRPPLDLVFEYRSVVVVAQHEEVVAVLHEPVDDELRVGVAVRLGGVGVQIAFVPCAVGHR